MKSNAEPTGRQGDSSRATDAAGGHWRVGLAGRCITPKTPLWLYGYATKRRFTASRGVLDDLYARAVSLGTPDGGTAIILTLDLCVVRKPLAERIVNGVSARTGVPPERILLNVSHTHSGPALAQEDTPGRFPMSADDYRRTQRYTEWMTEQAVAAAAESVDAMAPGRLSWASGRAGFVVNRRRLDEQGRWIGMGPAPDGPVDRDVPVLRVDDLEGRPRAVVFGCACHNVTLDDRNLLISADYAGYARRRIESALPGVTSVFLAGCGADANSEPRGGKEQVEHVKRHGRSLGDEVLRVMSGRLESVAPRLRCARTTAALPLRRLDSAALQAMASGPDWQAWNARRMMEALSRGETLPRRYVAPFSVWRLGDGLMLIGLSGEVVSEYALRLKRELAGAVPWVAGYCHEVFGYLPSARILAGGGYETRGLLPPGTGYFDPAVEDVVVRTIHDLAGRC